MFALQKLWLCLCDLFILADPKAVGISSRGNVNERFTQLDVLYLSSNHVPVQFLYLVASLVWNVLFGVRSWSRRWGDPLF